MNLQQMRKYQKLWFELVKQFADRAHEEGNLRQLLAIATYSARRKEIKDLN